MELSLCEWQEQIALCPARFQFAAAGRRAGKSFAAAARIILRSLSRRDHKTMYCSPSTAQGEEVFENIIGTDGIENHVEKIRVRPLRIWFNGNSRCEFRSLERSQFIRGRGLDDLIIDESQSVEERIYNSVCRPLISDRFGSVLLLGQFRGAAEWRYKKFFLPGQAAPGSAENPMDFGTPRYKSWRIPSWEGPMFQTAHGKAELEIAKAQLPRYEFNIEYGCEILSSPLAVFSSEQLEKITSGKMCDQPEHRSGYCIGLDIGKVRDPSALTVLDCVTGKVVYAERFPRGEEHRDQAKRAARLQNFWNNAPIIIDSTGGATGGHAPVDEYVECYRDFCSDVHPVWLNYSNKTQVIRSLILAVEQNQISIPSECSELLDEMGTFECEYKNGFYRFAGPGGHRDDLCVSLALANWGNKQGWVNTGRGRPILFN